MARAGRAHAFEIARRRDGSRRRCTSPASMITPATSPCASRRSSRVEVVPGEHLEAVRGLRVLAGAAGDGHRRSPPGRRRWAPAPSTTGCCRTSRDSGPRTSGSMSPAGRGAGEPQRRLHRPRSPRSRSACARRTAPSRRRGAPPRPRPRSGRRTGCRASSCRCTASRTDGGAVAEDHRPHAEVVVDQPVAVDVEEVGALGALEHQRRRRDAEAEIAVDAAGDVLRASPIRRADSERLPRRSRGGLGGGEVTAALPLGSVRRKETSRHFL